MKYPSLREASKAFNHLLEQGKTLEAIDQFYAEEATQYENNQLLLSGKSKLYTHEEMNIKGVNSFALKCQNVIVDEDKQLVWGEMKIKVDSKKFGKKKLTEAFFQQWENGKIVKQKFYYKGFED